MKDNHLASLTPANYREFLYDEENAAIKIVGAFESSVGSFHLKARQWRDGRG